MAEAMLDESLALAVEGDLYLRGQIWTAFAYARLFGGDVAGATEALERALEIHREAGDSIFIMEDLVGLAGVAISAGDLETARPAWSTMRTRRRSPRRTPSRSPA